MHVTVEIVVIFVLVLGNGILAMAEIAVVSARKARLQQRAEAGDRGAVAALELKADSGRFLSTVQVGITLVGILAGAFGGATLARQLAATLVDLPVVGAHADAVALALVVAGVTLLSLVVGELVPKQIALGAPDALASRLARPMRVLARAGAPAVSFLDLATRGILRLLRIRPSTDPPVTDDELRLLLDAGRRAGVFELVEQDIVERVLRLGDRRVGELVTPRSQLAALDADDPPEKTAATVLSRRYAFYPVYEGDLDHVIGLVSLHDIYAAAVAGRTLDLRALMSAPVFLPESLPAYEALERLRRAGLHAAFVFDEYGGMEGLLTLSDVLEALVGDLPSVHEPEPMVTRREDGSWLLDGMLPSGEVGAVLQLTAAARDELEELQTLGGFVMGRIGRVPVAGDAFTFAGHRFEVVDMDRRRVDQVLVVPPRAEPPPHS